MKIKKMKTYNFSIVLKIFIFIFLMSAIVCCNSNSNNKRVAKDDTSVTLTTSNFKDSIPDSIVQFLITSASNDFYNHQPPTPIDFRNVKVGYLMSNNKKVYILCGKFLSQDKKEKWVNFATIKTSGYEQYLGNQALSFCQQATMILTNGTNLSVELKTSWLR